jgi:DNA-binding MarR family transcriptional regulator
MGTNKEIWSKLHRSKIQELEDLRLDYNKILTVKITKALKQGVPIEDTLKSFHKMKGRYLEALCAYGSFGLAPQELHKKRSIWLYCPNEETTVRVKTVSMFLNRLGRSGLAERKVEGRTYRYFITASGRKRLNYYIQIRDVLSRTLE